MKASVLLGIGLLVGLAAGLAASAARSPAFGADLSWQLRSMLHPAGKVGERLQP